MAELILTDEERAADSYLDWDDAEIGQMVRKLAARVRAGDCVEEAMLGVTGAHLLIGLSRAVATEKRTTTLNGVIYLNECLGDWEVTVRRIRAPAKQNDSKNER